VCECVKLCVHECVCVCVSECCVNVCDKVNVYVSVCERV